MEKNARWPSLAEAVSFILLFAALATIQILIGGTRMVFSLPGYGLLGLAGLLAAFSLRRSKPVPSQLCLAISVIFFAYILVRALLSPVPYLTRSDINSVLAGLVVYFLVACILTQARLRIWLVVLLLMLAVGHVLIGAVQFRDGNNFMPISWLQRFNYERRASGFYICPNHLAGLLEVLGVLGLSVVCWSRWPTWGKLLVGYTVAITYVGLVLTGSRGGYLSAGASLLVFAILSLAILRRSGGNMFWKVGAVGAMAAIILGCAVAYSVGKSAFLKDRAQNTFDTSNMRISLWKGAIQQWELQPVSGTGSGTYLYFGRLFRTDQMQLDPIYVHNDYLHLLAEYGLLGAIGMAAFLFVHLWRGMQNFSRLGPKRVALSPQPLSNALALNVGALSAVSSILVHSIFDFNMHIPANVLLMAFVFALLANDGVFWERERPAPSRGQTVWRMLLPALGLVLIVQCARLLPGEYFSERARMAVRDQQPGLGLLFSLRGLRYDPQNPDLYYRLGAARMELGDANDDPVAASSFHRAAITAFERARALAPREESYALELATALDQIGRFDDAEPVFADILRLDPRSKSVRRSYEGHLKMRHGREESSAPPGPSQVVR